MLSNPILPKNFSRIQVKSHDIGIVGEVELVVHWIHATGLKTDLVRNRARFQIRQLRYFSRLEINAVKIQRVLPLRTDDQLRATGVPAGIREVEMMAVRLVVGQLRHSCTGHRVGV